MARNTSHDGSNEPRTPTAGETGSLGGENVHDDIRRNAGNSGTFEDSGKLTINPSATGDIGAHGSADMQATVTTLDLAGDCRVHKQNGFKQGMHGDALERGQNMQLTDEEARTFPLAQEEEIDGRTQEANEQRKRAIEVAKAGEGASRLRAENCREDVADTCDNTRELHPDAQAEIDEEVEHRANTTVWERLGQEVAGEVNAYAKSVADKLPDHITRAEVAKRIAARIDARNTSDGGVHETAKTVFGRIRGENQIVEPLAEIDHFERDRATVEVFTKTLFKPNADSQEQVGWTTDNSGKDAKVVKWKKSQQKTMLRVGQKIRLEDVEVGFSYNDHNDQWIMTMAITSDTTMEVIEEGHGDATRSPRSKPKSNHNTWSRCNTLESKKHQRVINNRLQEKAPERTTNPGLDKEMEEVGAFRDELSPMQKMIKWADIGRCPVDDCDSHTHHSVDKDAFDSVGDLIEHLGIKADSCPKHEKVNAALLAGE